MAKDIQTDLELNSKRIDGAANIPLENYAAAVAPGVGDDDADGYAVGSRWIDTVANKEYVCLDASTGAAVWTETTGGGGGSGESVTLTVRKGSAGTITALTPVYLDGWNPSGFAEVEQCDADDATKMPCIGLSSGSITNAADAELTVLGLLETLDTSAFAVKDRLYVSDAGVLTATRPANADDAVQFVATVIRSHVSLGVIEVAGAFRSNDIPNRQRTDRFRVVDSTDETKGLIYDASGITTATDRVWTVPDADIDFNNPNFPGNEGMGVPTGTTAQEPALPAEGDVRYDSDLDRLMFWNGTFFEPCGSWDFKFKDATETISSSTTLQDDDALAGIVLPADTWFYAHGLLVHNAGTTPDLKITWSASQTPQAGQHGLDANADNSFGSTLFVSGRAQAYFATFFWWIHTHATLSTTINFQWAQNTSSATASRVEQGSWIKVFKAQNG